MADWTEVDSLDALKRSIESGAPALVYLSNPNCSVCHALRPKLAERLGQAAPGLPLHYVDLERHPEAIGEYSAFTVPTVLVFLEGREAMREARQISVERFASQTARLWELVSGE